jgi:hypothetical protein
MRVVSAVESNLYLFRPALTWWNDFNYASRQGGAGRFGNSRTIYISFRDSCGRRHARFRHFFLDARICRIPLEILNFLMPHTSIVTVRWGTFSTISHSSDIISRKARP